MKKTVIIPGRTPHSTALQEAARTLGVDAVVAVDPADIARQAVQCNPNGILPMPEPYTDAANETAASLNLWAPKTETTARIQDKGTLRSVLAEHHIPQPPYAMADSETSAFEAARTLGTPVVIKPAVGYASRGVRLVRYIEDVPLAVKQAWRSAGNRQVLVEKYITGSKFCVDAVIRHDTVYVQGVLEEVDDDVHCYARGAVAPARSKVDAGVWSTLVTAVARACGFDDGWLHVTFGGAGPEFMVIRMAPYPAFFRYPVDLFSFGPGTDTVANAILAAVGGEPRPARFKKHAAAVVWVRTGSGVVKQLHGFGEAEGSRAVTGLKVGEVLGHAENRNLRDHLGYAIVVGPSSQKAFKQAREVAGQCRIVMSPLL